MFCPFQKSQRVVLYLISKSLHLTEDQSHEPPEPRAVSSPMTAKTTLQSSNSPPTKRKRCQTHAEQWLDKSRAPVSLSRQCSKQPFRSTSVRPRVRRTCAWRVWQWTRSSTRTEEVTTSTSVSRLLSHVFCLQVRRHRVTSHHGPPVDTRRFESVSINEKRANCANNDSSCVSLCWVRMILCFIICNFYAYCTLNFRYFKKFSSF